MSTVNNVFFAIAGVFMLALSIRLLWLSFKTKGIPERLFGGAWLVGALGAVFDAVRTSLTAPDAVLPWTWATSLTYPWVVILLCFSCYRLFRSRERWAGVVAYAVTAILLAVLVLQAFVFGVGNNLGETNRPLDDWAYNAGMTVALLWTALECLRHFRMARKRWRIGLADSLLAYRYLSWGVGATLMFSYFVLLWIAQFLGLPRHFHNMFLPFTSSISTALMYATFFPPRWLRKRLDRESPAS